MVSLDLEDPAHTCPSPWIESATPERSCVAPENINICPGLSFPVSGLTYNRVCGRAVGYAASSVDAFDDYRNLNDIDLPYFNGVSVTHGSPRLHIWSFAAGHGSHCPCENGGGRLPHTFVGNTISVMVTTMEHFGTDWTARLPAAPSTLLLGSM